MNSNRSLFGTPCTSENNIRTSSSLAPGDRILFVKCSMVLIETQSDVEVSKDITFFLRAIQEDKNFDIRQFINRNFFAEVWLKLTRFARGRAAGRTAATLVFIEDYLHDYLQASNFFPPGFCYGQQVSLIEGAKNFTAYSNNFQMRLGNNFGHAVKHLLRIRQRHAELTADRKREEIVHRLWNCDMAACWNMVDIVRSPRVGNVIPPQISTRRGSPRPTEKCKDPKKSSKH
ncbi:uncharacterized protein EV154DRAFT_568365 [Mucor mucedo]|uniref:uncharacterized protein n=1 Tax=Mucor mucedo TaxID=29922 RepID=UPI00222098DA|nr:uncharacterized protein EV154DRAFT_568365 [Mucor mucedo]KAI7881243.1 hypothetical protein EV154DRAFT_568365 [Mucor mucedo]